MSSLRFISEAEEQLRTAVRSMRAAQEALEKDGQKFGDTARALQIGITNAQTSLLWVQAAHFGGVS